MDSLTQIVLGASVAELVAGKKMGNRAMVWGAALGTLPDLDILLNRFYTPLDAMAMHRGFTHSIFFALLCAPILSWVLHRLYKRRNYGRATWFWLCFWALFTHPLLDAFTSWGTQLFYPLSSYRVALNTLFIIDPIYTLPFLVCVIGASFFARSNPRRRTWNKTGLVLSCTYIVLTCIAHLWVRYSLHVNGPDPKPEQRVYLTPAPLSSMLWWGVIDQGDELWMGYVHLFQKPRPKDFVKIKRILDTDHFPESTLASQDFKTIRWITNDFWVVRQGHDPGSWSIVDLRMGDVELLFPTRQDQVKLDAMTQGTLHFDIPLTTQGRAGVVTPHWTRSKQNAAVIKQLWKRICLSW